MNIMNVSSSEEESLESSGDISHLLWDSGPGLLDIGTGCSNYFTMTGVSFLFQTHCEKLVKTLTNEQHKNFKNLPSDMDRIRYMYSNAIKLPIAQYPAEKSQKDALDFKTYGNMLFQSKKTRLALKEYNEGIVSCPVQTEETRTLLSVLIANRSAALYELNLFEECIRDIDWVLKSGWYPNNLRYKILVRKGKSCIELGFYQAALKSFNEALKVGEKLPEQKLNEINVLLKETEEKIKSHKEEKKKKSGETANTSLFERNPLYPAASASVTFEYNSMFGRHAVATEDIKAGTVVLEEEAYCIAVSKENIMDNCTHCALSTVSPIPCENCSTVVFCSLKCKEQAKYHKIECPILPTVYNSGASVNCLMSLRIITQKGFSFFWTQKGDFNEFSDDVYDGKDYCRVYQLCTHSDIRPKDEFLHYTFMAIFLLRLLKRTAFFPFATKDEVLREEEAYIGSLLLRHLELLQFNAHELSEMRNMEVGDIPYRNAHVGGAIYPTLALFNHSCEPSIIRYNKGNKMVARTVKCITAGSHIFENYGPIYCTHEYAVRQKKMKERYYFTCQCIPCLENWPLYQMMDTEVLRLKCQVCGSALIVAKNHENPFVVCKECRRRNNIMINSLQLMKVDGFTTKAEEQFKEGNYEAAIKFYQTAMDYYHAYMVPPFQDMVKVQQRLRTCMLHDGNTEVLYKKPTEFLSMTSDTSDSESE